MPSARGTLGALARVVGIGAITVVMANCDSTEIRSRQAALTFFQGEHGRPGRLISSWPSAKKEEVIRLRRAALGLPEDWEYLDETLDVRDLGGFDFFIRYVATFVRRAENEMYTSEELFYSPMIEDWEPVPLRSREELVRGDGTVVVVRERTLWNCDFDAFMEGHSVKCF